MTVTALLQGLLAVTVVIAAALVIRDPHGTGLAVHHALLALGSFVNTSAAGK